MSKVVGTSFCSGIKPIIRLRGLFKARGKRRRRYASLLGVISLLALCNGCVNTAIGPDPQANVGTYSYVTRHLESLYSVPLQDLWPATLAALRNLKLTLEENHLDALGGKVLARRADGTRVKIWLDPVGARTTSVHVRIGFWGSKDLSELVHQEIRRELGF